MIFILNCITNMKMATQATQQLQKLVKNPNPVNMEDVHKLVQQGAEIGQQGADPTVHNNTILEWSSFNGHLNVVKYLLSNTIVKLSVGPHWAVQLACQGDHIDIVKYLVLQGADIRAENDLALRLAAWNNNIEIVKYIILDLHVPLSAIEIIGMNGKAEPFIRIKNQIAAIRLQRWWRKNWHRRKLHIIRRITIPLYYHPQRKGGYFAKKSINDFLKTLT